MKNTKIIIVANDERERNVMYSRLRELRDELNTSMSMYNTISNGNRACMNVYFGNIVTIEIYLKKYRYVDGLRCDYFAISTFDIDYAEKWQKQLSPYGKELTTFYAITEKIKELTSNTGFKFDENGINVSKTRTDITIMKDIIKQYMDNDIQEVQSAATRHQVYYGQYFRPLKTFVPAIRKVIFNDPATIVFWMDGTKTIVKAQDGDIFDPEKGLTMAITKKALGNEGNYCNELKKWLPKEETLGFCTMSELEESLRKLGEVASKTPFPIPKPDFEAK